MLTGAPDMQTREIKTIIATLVYLVHPPRQVSNNAVQIWCFDSAAKMPGHNTMPGGVSGVILNKSCFDNNHSQVINMPWLKVRAALPCKEGRR